jgi:acyl-CoA thioesterase
MNPAVNPDLTKLTQNDRMAQLLGLRLIRVEPNYALVEMEIKEDHLNGIGGLHGGVIFTLADYAFAVACNSGGVPTVAINANISYFKTAKGKIISAEAKEVSSGRKICCCQVDVFDEDKTLIARFSGTGYRKT